MRACVFFAYLMWKAYNNIRKSQGTITECLAKLEKARARQQCLAREEEESDHEKSDSPIILGRFGTGCKQEEIEF